MYLVKRQWTNAKKQEVNGYRYDSAFEAQYGLFLEAELKAKRIISFERQVTIPLVVNDYTLTTYRIDFIVNHLYVTKEDVECKGCHTN